MSQLIKMLEADFEQRVANHANTQSAQQDAEPGEQRNLADNESAIQQVLGRIFSTPSDSSRAVLFLNDSDLKDRYLSVKGESKIVEALDDSQVAAIFPQAQFQVEGGSQNEPAVLTLAQNFDMNSLDKPVAASRPYAVLLNVPKNLAQYFSTKNPTDIEDARKIILQMIAHKNYVATLNAANIKKANVGPLTDRDEREEQFNVIKFITAYPSRSQIDAARQEQQDKDRNKKVTPDGVQPGAAPEEKKKQQLTAEEQQLAQEIATTGRRLFLGTSSVGWPTEAEKLKALRDKLVAILTKDPRIGDRTYMIPTIVKYFYIPAVKQDANYQNLLKLLADDADFMKLASGEEPTPDEESTDQPGDEGEAQQEVSSEEQPPEETNSPKTPEEVADEIKAQGDEYADQVAKILGGQRAAEPTPEPTAQETEPELPDDVKQEVERLKKIKANAINPKQREKAAADLATLLHREEEKRKAKSKAKRR